MGTRHYWRILARGTRNLSAHRRPAAAAREHLAGAEVAREDDDGVPEVDEPAAAVGEPAVVQQLQARERIVTAQRTDAVIIDRSAHLQQSVPHRTVRLLHLSWGGHVLLLTDLDSWHSKPI